MTSFISNMLDYLYPPHCLSCKKPTASNHNLCATCWNTLEPITSACQHCGKPLEFTSDSPVACAECLKSPPAYYQLRYCFPYCDTSKSLITQFKYGDQHANRIFITKHMLRVSKEMMAEIDLMIPVPLHPFKLWLRRFNQSALLAASLAAETGVPIAYQGLKRIRFTKPQAGLSKSARLKNIRGAFSVPNRAKPLIQNKHLLLIDDVITTGHTINACVNTLQRAGADKVSVLSFARRIAT